MKAAVYSVKSGKMVESEFVRNGDAAKYLQETRGKRLAGFRKGLVQLALSGKELTTEQQFHLHNFATMAKKKDERLAAQIVVPVLKADVENDLFAYAG